MQPKKEFSDSFKQFVQVQNNNNLANIQVDGVYIWRLIRSNLFVQQLENKKIFLKSEVKSTSVFQRMKMAVKNILGLALTPSKWQQLPKNIVKLKPLAIDIINILPSLVFTSKLLVFGSSKTVFVSAFIRNIGDGHKLTQPCEEKYKSECVLLDKPNAGLFSLNRVDTRAFNFLARRFFKSEIIEDIAPAANQISIAYGLEEHVVNRLIRKHLKTFKAHEAAFLHLFNQSKFQKLYLCWNRYYMPILSAAKKSGITTSEFQHGTITPYHIMYSWEGFDEVPYSPDRLLCFGPSWPSESNLAKSIVPEVVGAPHLEKCQAKYATRTADKNQVVVFSQNIIGLKLLEFSIKVARLRPDLSFIFKPHPAEYYANISEYISGEVPSNFQLASANDDSYKLMAGASYQIGVSSTTLNEGMVFGNRVIIVPLASWEYLENAIRLGHATMAYTPENAAELLNPSSPVCAEPESYYAPVNLTKL